MPRKPFLNSKSDKYVLIIFSGGGSHTCYEYFTASSAVNAYRKYHEIYGDSVRLAKVVIDYGEEI